MQGSNTINSKDSHLGARKQVKSENMGGQHNGKESFDLGKRIEGNLKFGLRNNNYKDGRHFRV